MEENCIQCGSAFEILENDLRLYDKVSPVINGKKYPIPAPDSCPNCRQRQRLASRNEKTLYKRPCSLCKKDMVSLYDKGTAFPVYCQECFWGDSWNASDFGKDFDFSRPFFEQFEELMNVVPRLSLVNKQSENSEYCNYAFQNKNCYLLFGSHYEEDCMYGGYSTKNKNCLDYLWIYESELSYQCTFSSKAYRSAFLDYCHSCNDCFFGFDLKGCSDCLFSHNLRNKKYHIFNKEYSKEEYEKYLKELKLGSHESLEKLQESWNEYKKNNAIFKDSHQTNCENCEGSDHQNSKNLKFCFACTDCDDCAYGFQMDQTYSSIDNSHAGYDRCELAYNTIGNNGIFHCLVTDSCWHDSDTYYSQLCFSSQNCFGSIGLRQSKYHILNKEYSEEEYFALLGRIFDHMKSTEEWGQYFPFSIFPYGYNETVAMGHYPMTKEQVLAAGWNWKDESASMATGQAAYQIPDHIQDVTGDICNQVLTCEVTGKVYKILPQELKFYNTLGLPIPRKCFDQRYHERIAARNSAYLWSGNCSKCNVDIQSTYAPERPEKVYCEKCYLKEVY